MNNINQYKHSTKIKVRFSDLDAMQHVNNATYLSYLEEARLSYFNDIFNTQINNLDFEAIIGRIEIDYLIPIMFGDEVEVFTRTVKLGNKSIDVEHIIAIKKGNEFVKAATSSTKLVYYDYKKQISKEIPEEIKKTIAQFEELSF